MNVTKHSQKIFIIFFLHLLIFSSFLLLFSNIYNLNTDLREDLKLNEPDYESKFSTKRTGIISDGNEPNINGTIITSEWENAKLFNKTDTYKMMEIFIQRNSTHLFIGVIAYTTDDLCLMTFDFDEGDDGWHGSGSQDHEFKAGQDDFKAFWTDETLADGNYDDSGSFNYSFTDVDFEGKCTDYGNYYNIELYFPLVGVDGKSVDCSDLNVSTSDIIGFNLCFIYDTDSKNSHMAGQYGDYFTYIDLETMEMGIDTFLIGITPDGTEPNINGTIFDSEWENALNFTYLDKKGTAKIYFLRNSTHIMIAASYLDTVYDIDDEFIIFIDEGNDGNYGSGTRDENWINNQDDVKKLSPIDISDGHALSSGYTLSSNDVDFIGFMNYVTDHWEVELSMPLEGEEGKANDYSDLTASIFDEIGICISIENDSAYDTCLPSHNYDYSNPQFFLKLKLGHINGSQSVSTRNQSAENGKVWLNGTAYTDLGNLSEISIYSPSPDNTNATGVTWSTNQGTNESWAFYNTSYIPSGRYFTKINISNDQGPSYSSYINLTAEYFLDFTPPTANQDPSNNASNIQNGGIDVRYWIRGSADDALSGLNNISVYDPASDTTNATGVTWSSNQGTLSSWEFYNTSEVSEGIFWIKVKVEDNFGNYVNLTTNVSFMYNDPPSLTDQTVTPTLGNVSTIYNFTVNYSDPNNDPPSFVYLNSNQTGNLTMSKIISSDDNYIDGVIYTISTILESEGHEFDFYTSDGIIEVNSTPMTDIYNDNLIKSSGLVVTPTIDGNYNTASEWSDATLIYNPIETLLHYIYVKNDQDYLYCLIDFVGDDEYHFSYDHVRYYFDILNDNTLTSNSEAMVYHDVSNTNMLKWYWTGSTWINNDSASDVGIECQASFSSSVNSGSSHGVYECKIPLSYLKVNPGDTIGFAVNTRSLYPGIYEGYFPYQFNVNNPITYSDLLLNIPIQYPEIILIEPFNITYPSNSIPVICENSSIVEQVWIRNKTSGVWSNNVSLSYNTTHWVNNSNLFWPDQAYQFQIFANNSLGLERMIERYFKVDTLKPLISISTPLNDSMITNSQIWINGTINSTGSLISSFNINNTGNFSICIDPTGLDQGNFAIWNSTPLEDKIYSLIIITTDLAGHVNSILIYFQVSNIGLLNPTIQLSVPRYNFDAIGGENLILEGSTLGVSSIIDCIWVNNTPSFNWSLLVDPSGTSGGTFIFVNASPIIDGIYAINITVNNTNGNHTSLILSFYVDNLPPITPPNFSYVLSGNNVTLSWDNVGDLTNVTYIIYRNDVNIVNVTGLTYTDVGLSPGTYNYTVIVIDNAGNICKNATGKIVVISGSGGDNPWDNLWFFIIIILIICLGAVAIASIGITFRRRNSRRSGELQKGLYKGKYKGKETWIGKVIGFSPELNSKLSDLNKKPQKVEEIKDAILIEFLKKPFTLLSPILIKKLDQLTLTENEKIEILETLLIVPPEQREQFIDELIEDENEENH
ncbi:MAG: hypothetical protein EAX96_10385 [Candidatus Lokiarchaeota archaeon]|nr:hypothetical protein [Candidatus Lokiarchaeota archaeon]